MFSRGFYVKSNIFNLKNGMTTKVSRLVEFQTSVARGASDHDQNHFYIDDEIRGFFQRLLPPNKLGARLIYIRGVFRKLRIFLDFADFESPIVKFCFFFFCFVGKHTREVR